MAKVTAPVAAPKAAAPAAEATKPADVKAPAAPAGAAPGTKDEKATKEAKPAKVKRVIYPGLWDEKTETRLKLADIPADYDAKKHKPLGRKDFEKESLWYEMRARKCEEQAKKYREMGVEADTIGNSTEKGKLKRLAVMAKRYEELVAQLKEAGVSEDEIKAALGTGK